jgi:DNA-binding NtrC family response regulator
LKIENRKWSVPQVSKAETNNAMSSQQKDRVANVLIVDDDPELARFMLEILARKGIRANLANDKKTAVGLLDKDSYDLVFTSDKIRQHPALPHQPQGSFELLAKIRTNSPEMPVIMVGQPDFAGPQTQNQQQVVETNPQCNSLHWATQTAVKAIRAGCCDFLIKPLDRQKIENLLDTFLPNHSVSTIASAEQGTQSLYRIVGRSAKLLQTVNLVKKVAPTSVPVLISGESGTGKELISYLIHHKSRRAQGPYIKVNCAALSDSLLESELFGHEKGAFTGAYTQRKGRFEMAHGGTLLLDEITETPLKFQAKLLRVLEQQDFERVGGEKQVRVDVRIISTTNKDLLQEVVKGRLRQDLYYRLSGVRLVIPPLRERAEDLPDLVWHFVNLYAHETQRRITKLNSAMMDIFTKYHWPGNIRQLRNVVLTSLILGDGSKLSLADVSWLFNELQPLPQQRRSDFTDGSQNCQPNTLPPSRLAGVPLVQIEQQAILDTLRHTAGNQTKAAKVLGISDRTLRDKLRRYRQQDCTTPPCSTLQNAESVCS